MDIIILLKSICFTIIPHTFLRFMYLIFCKIIVIKSNINKVDVMEQFVQVSRTR